MSASTKINISHTYYVTLHYICGVCVPKLLLELRIDSNECVMCICFRFWFNPTLLTIVDTSKMPIEFGDFVVVTDSTKKLKSLQDGTHGGWNDEMLKV